MSSKIRLFFVMGLVLIVVALLVSGAAAIQPTATFAVRIASEDVNAAARLNLSPQIALDYGSFQWLVLNADDWQRLQDSGIPFTLERDAGTVQVQHYRFDPVVDGEPNINPALRQNETDATFRLVQFYGPTNDTWLAEMTAAGLPALQYYPHNAFLTWGTAAQTEALTSQPYVRWQGAVHPAYKINQELMGYTGLINQVDVMFYNDGDINATLAQIEALGGVIVQHYPAQPDKAFYDAIVLLDAAALPAVAHINTVLWLGYADPNPVLDDEMSAQIIAGNYTAGVPFPGYQAHLTAMGVDGSGVIWAITDSGVDYSHPDLNTRIVGGRNYPGCNPANPGDSTSNGHGTHVAGIVGGDATAGFMDASGFLYGLGVAPEYSIYAQNPICNTQSSWPPAGGWQELTKWPVLAGAVGSNNSWTTGEPPTPHGYQASERTHDITVLDGNFDTATVAEPYIHVFSAGNSGSSGLTAPKEGKNLIVVANSLNYRAGNIDTISGSSSVGPAVDGRWVPNVAAPGTSIASTRADGGGSCTTAIPGTSNMYALCSGTSMAAPHVSGVVVLTTQWWRTTHAGDDPSPAMAKALVVNSAVDMGTANIPNISEGWGRVNVTNIISPSVSVIRYDQPVVFGNTGEQYTLQAVVDDPSHPMKITLAWADAPGAVGANPALVNDLDLTVTLGGNTYLGNRFASGWSITGGTRDSINNLENVYVQVPGANEINITITAMNISGDAILYNADTTDQSFALVCYNCSLEPTFALEADPATQNVCIPADGIFTVDVNSIGGFSGAVALSAAGNPAGTTATFSPNNSTAPYTSTLTIGNTTAAAPGDYPLTITATSGAITRTTGITLSLNAIPGTTTLVAPANGATNQPFTPTFTWQTDPLAVSYTLEVATDNGFSNIVYNQTGLTSTTHVATTPLDPETTYYWRVRATNGCGDGSNSSTFSFTTEEGTQYNYLPVMLNP